MKNFLVNTLIFLLVLVGSLLVGWHFIQEDVILFFTQVPIVTEEFEINLVETEETAVFDWDVVTQLDTNYWLQYIDLDDEVSPIGELILPSIDTRLPVFHGVGEPNITIGAGTMLPGLVMGEGNYSLASHWDPNPGIRFGGLPLIQVGDLILLRDANYLYIYETIIGDNYVIEPDRWDIVDYVEGETLVTLMTCTPDGYQRVMVRGELVDQVSMEELRADAEALSTIVNTEVLSITSVEAIIEVVETLEYPEIPFPFVEVATATGGSLLLAALIVRISNRGSKRKDD